DAVGIVLDADATGMIAERNKVTRAAQAIQVDGDDITVQRNKVKEIGADRRNDHCFSVNGMNNTVTGNQATDCHGDGINISGTGNTIQANTLVDLIEDGIDVGASDNIVDGNVVKNVNGVALEVDLGVTGVTVRNNSVSKARHMLCDEGTGTVLANNVSKNVDQPDQLNTGNTCPIDG
ncbi:MAG: right-handed parallel beta-helix repeat-containing protein, partial [Myxococcota bacterium]